MNRLLFVAAAGGLCATSLNAAETGPIINTPTAGLNWKATAKGVGFTALQGDRFNEYYMAILRLPAGLPHVSQCVSAVDCVTFLYQDGKFYFLPVGQ